MSYSYARDGIETLSVAFTTSEKRASWEESFSETKLKLRGTISQEYLTNSNDYYSFVVSNVTRTSTATWILDAVTYS